MEKAYFRLTLLFLFASAFSFSLFNRLSRDSRALGDEPYCIMKALSEV